MLPDLKKYGLMLPITRHMTTRTKNAGTSFVLNAFSNVFFNLIPPKSVLFSPSVSLKIPQKFGFVLCGNKMVCPSTYIKKLTQLDILRFLSFSKCFIFSLISMNLTTFQY